MKKIVLFIIIAAFLIVCVPPRFEPHGAAAIPVAGERLSLSPLISEAEIKDLPDWPTDPVQQKILLEKFNEIWKKLQAEFRRCEKWGLYTMVDDKNNPTVRISIIITSVRLANDTLSMPIRLQAERLRDDQRFFYTIPAIATVPSAKKPSRPFHYYGQLLTDYSRRFPFTVLVSFFLPP